MKLGRYIVEKKDLGDDKEHYSFYTLDKSFSPALELLQWTVDIYNHVDYGYVWRAWKSNAGYIDQDKVPMTVASFAHGLTMQLRSQYND